MRLRLKAFFGAVAAGALLAAATAGPASAAPITCPEGQTATKTSPGTWECVNKAGKGNPNTEETKNPND